MRLRTASASECPADLVVIALRAAIFGQALHQPLGAEGGADFSVGSEGLSKAGLAKS
jgi:hypothetical protein